MITEWLFGSRSRERAATKEVLGHPSSGIIGWLDRKSHAGVQVDPQTAMQTSTVWACTRLLASSIACLPLNLYRPRPGGGNQVATSDPVHRLVHSEPNDDMTSMLFRASRVTKQVNLGNAFAEIERDQLDRPIALHPINTALVRLERDPETDELTYFVRSAYGRMEVEIPPADMLHLPYPVSEDGIVGQGVVLQAAESIGYTIATERMFSSTMANSATPPIVVKHKKKMSDDARRNFRREWNEIHQGPDRSGNLAQLADGAELEQMGFNHQEVQMLQMRQFNVEDLARWYGVPQHMVGHLLRSTNNNIEHQGIEFVKYSLVSLLKVWEQELWRKLLTRRQQDEGWYFKHLVDALERGDLPSRTDSNMKRFMNGNLTLNEWRRMEDMDPLGAEGDVHFVPANLVPLERLLAGPVEPVQAPDDDEDEENTDEPADSPDDADDDDPDRNGGDEADHEAERDADENALAQPAADSAADPADVAARWAADVLGRFTRKEQRAAIRAARRPVPPERSSNGFLDWMDEFYPRHEQQLAEALTAPLAALDRGTASGLAEGVARLYCQTSQEELLSASDCSQAELPDRVAACVENWTETRTTLPELSHDS